MRRIAIVGGGQSGLQLALGLQQHGYKVTVVTDRSGEDIAAGRVMSSQCMFHTALEYERELGLNYWEAEGPYVEGMSMSIAGPDGSRPVHWSARLERPAQAIDQRVKYPRWMQEVEDRGGALIIERCDAAGLERLAKEHELVIVASGKGDLKDLFPASPARTMHGQPMRALALTYVKNMTPREEFTAVNFNIVPGVGEYFVFPALTTTGACEIMVFEGLPGGPMDCWGDVRTPQAHLAKSKWILDTFLPWEAARCQDVALTDDNGTLAGRFQPVVREPVARLPSGARVLGMADAVCLNDPITGQGSNNASKAAHAYLHAILERGRESLTDEAWMRATFDRAWTGEGVGAATLWTNALLLPPPPHVLQLFGAANTLGGIASRFVNAFDDPRDFGGWFLDPGGAERFIAEQQAGAAS